MTHRGGAPHKALVTGGSKGIGLAIARELRLKWGHEVTIMSRSDPEVAETFAHWIQCDVTNLPRDTGLQGAIAAAGFDILVNNVGGGGRWGHGYFGTTLETYELVHLKNALAAAAFTKLCLPRMIEAKWGRVVTVSSIHGKEAGGQPWFNMTKAAEIALMKSLSRDKVLVRQGITFNTVCPGYISVKGKADEKDLERLVPGRMGEPEEVAALVGWLCCDAASFVNGACITVDGGESVSY